VPGAPTPGACGHASPLATPPAWGWAATAAAASASSPPPTSATFLAASEAATSRLADLAGGYSRASTAAGVPPPTAGLVFALTGSVGAGKSAWARAFVRAAAGDPDLPVPSPTYLLHNVYDEVCEGEGGGEGARPPLPPIHHFDLYRLAGAGRDAQDAPGLAAFDIERTGLGDALQRGVSLIEWADRLGPGGAAAAAGRAGVSPPPAVVEVSIEALAPGEASAMAATATAGSLECDSESDSGGDDPFADDRPRAVRLVVGEGSGGAAAAARVAAVAAAVRAGAGGPGLALVE
jgi:tRNA threonylcarbamoyladenosine biosynthesis protein TsaE